MRARSSIRVPFLLIFSTCSTLRFSFPSSSAISASFLLMLRTFFWRVLRNGSFYYSTIQGLFLRFSFCGCGFFDIIQNIKIISNNHFNLFMYCIRQKQSKYSQKYLQSLHQSYFTNYSIECYMHYSLELIPLSPLLLSYWDSKLIIWQYVVYQAMGKYYKSYMKSALNICIVIVCLLAAVQANDTNNESGFNDTAPFQPIDLTELFKSLNITYQDILPNSKNDSAPQLGLNNSYISTNIQNTNNATQLTQINSGKYGPSNQNIELQTNTSFQSKSAKEQVVKPPLNETKSISAEQKYNKSDSASKNQSFEQIPPISTKSQIQKTNTEQLPLNRNALFSSLPLAPKKIVRDSFQNYQYQIRENSAIYNISASYRIFTNYFIITKTDEYLPQIKEYLIDNYGNYLSDGQVFAGFKMYNYYADNSIDYQLLYSTMYGTFIAILTYWQDTNHILLKSLSVINFYIMQIDYSNCFQINQDKQNCSICNKGYRNFMGRCHLFDSSCSQYITDECGSCSEGKVLSYGHCQ